MPLIQSAKKKALQENIKTEIDAHPEKSKRKQDLAIAFSVQRKNKKKKMASGGMVDEPGRDVVYEERKKPSVSDEYGDKPQADRNPGTPAKKKDDEKFADSEIMSQVFTDGPNPDVMDDDEDAPPKKDYSGDRYADGGMIGPDEASPHTGETREDMLRRHADELSAHPDNFRPDKEDYMGKDWAGGPDLEEDVGANKGPSKSEYDAADWGPSYADGGSVADSIMRKKAAKKYADGGEVDLQDNNGDEEGSNPYYKFNADAAKKETYYDDSQISKQPKDSNEKDNSKSGLYKTYSETGDSRETDDEDVNDAIDTIRRKLRVKRGI